MRRHVQRVSCWTEQRRRPPHLPQVLLTWASLLPACFGVHVACRAHELLILRMGLACRPIHVSACNTRGRG
jgi:hypothetical protein